MHQAVIELKRLYHYVKSYLAVLRYNNPSKRLTIIGVTGTDGKTTTSTLIYHLLKSAGKSVALISTVGAFIGAEEIDTGFHVTSPEAGQLQQLLSKIAKKGYEYVVLEATSHGLHQHRFLGISFAVAVVTNITHEHLDYHGTYERYVAAKSILFKQASLGFLNKRDGSYPLLSALLKNQELRTYDSENVPKEVGKAVKARFKESYNWSNAAAAYAVVTHLGIKPEEVIASLPTFPTIKGRMDEIETGLDFRVVVDFAHTPNALEKAMTALRQQTKSRLIAVFGSAGLRDHTKRPMMGEVGARLADYSIMTAEDPRTEPVWLILDAMMEGVKENRGHVFRIPDRQEAIEFAINLAREGDIVGVFGKGHEQSMCFGTKELPWSDHQAIKKAIKHLKAQKKS